VALRGADPVRWPGCCTALGDRSPPGAPAGAPSRDRGVACRS
jgi:hypothetical protein